MTTPYTTLGLSPGASKSEVKRAYRALARRHHPDSGGDEAIFAEVTAAYEEIMNPSPATLFAEEDVKAGADIIKAMTATRLRTTLTVPKKAAKTGAEVTFSVDIPCSCDSQPAVFKGFPDGRCKHGSRVISTRLDLPPKSKTDDEFVIVRPEDEDCTLVVTLLVAG